MILPLVPVWYGFALNTVIYAVAGFALWRVVGWMRRHDRAERHECPNCGYSREGLAIGAVCPECGRSTQSE